MATNWNDRSAEAERKTAGHTALIKTFLRQRKRHCRQSLGSRWLTEPACPYWCQLHIHPSLVAHYMTHTHTTTHCKTHTHTFTHIFIRKVTAFSSHLVSNHFGILLLFFIYLCCVSHLLTQLCQSFLTEASNVVHNRTTTCMIVFTCTFS